MRDPLGVKAAGLARVGGVEGPAPLHDHAGVFEVDQALEEPRASPHMREIVV